MCATLTSTVCQRDHDGEQLAQGRAAATLRERHTQGAEARLADEIDCGEGPLAGALALERTFADRGDELRQPIRSVGRGLGLRLRHRHRVTSSVTRR